MTRDEAFERFQKAIAEVLDVEPSAVVRDAKWEKDLDADSLAVVEITLVLADEFDVSIPDELREDVFTYGDVVNLLRERLAARHS